jgi:uncharacterized membrane protein
MLSQNYNFRLYLPNLQVLSVLVWIGIGAIVFKIIQKYAQDNVLIIVGIGVLCISTLLPTYYAPYIAGAVYLLLVSFYFGYTTQVVLSLFLGVGCVSQYYYDLNFSLLFKSGILFFSGIAFLLAWAVFNWQIKKEIKNETT